MAHSKLYVQIMNSAEWQKLSKEWKAEHPLCEICYRDYDIITPAQCVHHIEPIESGKTDADCKRLAFSRGNLQSLCFACHSAIHKAERSHTKEVHQQRESERLERWKARHTNSKGD